MLSRSGTAEVNLSSVSQRITLQNEKQKVFDLLFLLYILKKFLA